LGPEKIRTAVNTYQEKFRARPKVEAFWAVGAQYQRSVIDRFATAAAACQMTGEVGLLWRDVDTDAVIEVCLLRWAEHEKLDPVVTAIAQFMHNQDSWEGTASSLLSGLGDVFDSPEALGRWLKKPKKLQRLKLAGFEVAQHREKSLKRSKRIRIERIGEKAK
jgi:hypothetical protein